MKRITQVKTLEDGRALLNIGCGKRTHWDWNNLDRSPYGRLVRHTSLARLLRWVGILSKRRYADLMAVDPRMILWDVRSGLPFDDDLFDAVYHSHFIGHIDRTWVPELMKECRRILKVGGAIRIVAPDLAQMVRRYTNAVAALDRGDTEAERDYDEAVRDMFELIVRKEAVGTLEQPPLVRMLERVVRGNAAEQGEAMRWQYDVHSIGRLLQEAGFRDVQRVDAVTSRIKGWTEFTLDTNEDGTVYKPGSFYLEAAK